MAEIILAATPIGNTLDASRHLCELLTSAQIIAAEDTRRLRDLARRLELEITAKVVPLHEHNEQEMAPKLVAQAQNGMQILAVTDAGMPSVSDPGYRLVQAALKSGLDVRVVPGPSAALTALVASGLATDRFCFEGFLPRKNGEQLSALQKLAREERTMIFFESPRRLAALLANMTEVFGAERPAAVCRELTKTYEETRRASLAELSAWASNSEVLGEIVVVVSGAKEQAEVTADLVDEVLRLSAAGLRLKTAASEVAGRFGLKPRELYEAALKAKE